MDDAIALLVTVTGWDRPGLTSTLCAEIARLGARILDMEQVTIRGRLTLGILISLGCEDETARVALATRARELGVTVEFKTMASRRPSPDGPRHYVTLLGQPLRAGAIAGITGRIAACGANIDRIVRLSRYPIMSFELLVSGGDPVTLRGELAAEAAVQHVDVAMQPAGLYRRAKRLICMDVDSTLVAGEVIELLAEHAGCAPQVAAITARAMAGELDFEQALRERVALLEGLPVEAVDHVREHLVLTPGAHTAVRTLKRLGYVLAIVSGGFTQITDDLKQRLSLDYAHANTLEVSGGRLTGRLIGPVVDRLAKAASLERFAAAAGVPLSQTVAVGDGANDLDMLAKAGLGIAFNAKPVVRRAADTALSVPYLDAILFLLGITREEIEAADAADPQFAALSTRKGARPRQTRPL
ncbi:MAG: phosphoserine phosphatase SerB [Chloroflexota bacterium]|nr:phosphoserine phosphatase SerB [Chloroflexota bacterium]